MSVITQAPRYILLTQCMQNDFFLNRECKLKLPDIEVKKMLIGGVANDSLQHLGTEKGGNRVKIEENKIKNGPLGQFLKSLVEQRRKGIDGKGLLHIINIRDWHGPGQNYDDERRKYGAHCEQNSWGGDYISGLKTYFNPLSKNGNSHFEEATFFQEGDVRIYHIHSDTVFDFKPRFESSGSRYSDGKYLASELELILDLITLGSDEQLDTLANILRTYKNSDEKPSRLKEIEKLSDNVKNISGNTHNIYAAVIGVYTDIKVITLLAGLHSRYQISNLAVSDTLTASASLERHLNGLDFAHKVLNVEVIHGLNDLLRYLGCSPTVDNELEIVVSQNYSRFSSFFLDKQNLLSYESEKLRDYIYLTQRRSENVYKAIERSNKFLLIWGAIFLSITLFGVVINAIARTEIFNWQSLLVTGGLSLIQLVTVFFRRPMDDMQKNLTNLAIFRMILESHSMKMALARYHLTTPQTLREDIDPEASKKQVAALEEEINVIEKIDFQDFQALTKLGFGVEEVVQTASNLELPSIETNKSRSKQK